MSETVSYDQFHNIINGKTKDAAEKHYGINPRTEEKLWPVPIANEKDVEEAVLAANAAFKTWSRTTLDERKKYIEAFRNEYMKHKDEIAKLLAAETGKPPFFVQNEIMGTAGWFGSHLAFDIPDIVSSDDKDAKVVTRYVPVGVVAGICPWNFPILLSMGKVVPALLTGNCIILKPSMPFTPYTALKICEIAQKVLPPGVFQALGGDDMLGPWLVKHPDIQKISFTGSIATGKKIQAAAADTLKRVSLELGGNDASIVCPDVDIAKVAKEVAIGSFANAGQICVATKRVYVHSSIYSEFIKAMSQVAQTFAPGGDFLGPVQNSMQYEKAKKFYDDCKAQNFDFALGDGNVTHKSGYFLQPTIVAQPPEKSMIVTEEPFAPIVPVMTWDDEEDVIDRANDTTTGLGACVWSKDPERADRIARRLEAGSVWVNSFEKPKPTAYFSGHKQSGIGGEWGQQGLYGYMNGKTYHYSKDSV
ncbi:MAG: hypothetical protein MMC23_002382 [Stictis urceolatum]|nr:hypothetical protein [Stictis urceolata]